MTQIPVIEERDIQQWVGITAYQRGLRYYEDGTILNPRHRGQSLIAECIGTRPTPYRVEICLGTDAIQWGNCTCPAGDGGHCKHAAALLLTWIYEPELFIEVPELEKVLESRSKADLISLIQQMVTRHPDLEQLLELSVLSNVPSGEALKQEVIARQIGRAYSIAGGEWGDNAKIAENLQPILDLGEDLLDREDAVNASVVYTTLMDGMLDYEESLYSDESGELGQVLAECEEGIEECLKLIHKPELRENMLHALFDLFLWNLKAGGLGYADETPNILIQQTTPAEKQRLAEWIQSELPKYEAGKKDYQRRTLGGLWLDLFAGQLDDDSYLQICRETGRTRDMTDRLLTLGRLEEAQAASREVPRDALTQTADLFEKHGYPDLALQMIREQPNSDSDLLLLRWLKEHALRHNQPEEALRLAETLFWQNQRLDHYIALLEAANSLNQRESVRERVLQRLESAGNFSLLVEIYLLENEVDLALAALERVNPDLWWGRVADLRRQVAEAVEVPRPRESIRLYLILAEDLIRKRSRGNYAEAARLLQQVRKLYHGLGEEERWESLVNSLRHEYNRLPALLDELRRAGL